MKDILKIRAIFSSARIPKSDRKANNARSACMQLLLTNDLIGDGDLNPHIRRLVKDLFPIFRGYMTINDYEKLKETSL